MRKIIDYFRTLFCKHEYELLCKDTVHDLTDKPIYIKWIYVCKKCKYKKKVTSEQGGDKHGLGVYTDVFLGGYLYFAWCNFVYNSK